MLRRLVQRLGVELDAAMPARLAGAPLKVLEQIVEDVVSDRDPDVISVSSLERLDGPTV